MSLPFKKLGLTQLEPLLTQVLETARREQWTYETFFERALAAELDGPERRAMERRIKAARLPGKKTLEAFDFSFQPALSERLLWELADLSFVRSCTHLSLALADRAVQASYSVLFTRLSQLAEALESASYPGLMRQRLRRYLTPSVLVIDEVGYINLSAEQARYFFELVTARYERGSIILTSNTSFAHWGQLLGDEILASALLDRLLHHAEVISINGRSYPLKERQAEQAASSALPLVVPTGASSSALGSAGPGV